MWYPAALDELHPDGRCKVILEVGRVPVDCQLQQLRLSPSRACLRRLAVGQQLQGIVKRVEPVLGAFVDVRSERTGLVRPSRMAEHYVDDAASHVQVGQSVEVWVYRLTEDGKMGLSMVDYPPCSVRDPVVTFHAALPSDWFDAVVRTVHKFGIYVDVEAPGNGKVQGLVPIRFLAGSPEVGQGVRVRVVRVLEGAGMLRLSMLKASSEEAPRHRQQG